MKSKESLINTLSNLEFLDKQLTEKIDVTFADVDKYIPKQKEILENIASDIESINKLIGAMNFISKLNKVSQIAVDTEKEKDKIMFS